MVTDIITVIIVIVVIVIIVVGVIIWTLINGANICMALMISVLCGEIVVIVVIVSNTVTVVIVVIFNIGSLMFTLRAPAGLPREDSSLAIAC